MELSAGCRVVMSGRSDPCKLIGTHKCSYPKHVLVTQYYMDVHGHHMLCEKRMQKTTTQHSSTKATSP